MTDTNLFALYPPAAESASLLFEGTKSEPAVQKFSVDANRVAHVSIRGTLNADTVTSFFGDRVATGYRDIQTAIQQAVDDPTIAAVLLEIHSPGGSVAGAQELVSYINAACKKKPMAAYTGGLMASAAYWIGSATGRVFSTETAEVGSIGVIMMLADQTAKNAKAGVTVNVISAGSMKSAGNPHAVLTDEQRAYFQEQADAMHAVFRNSVADSMGVSMNAASEWGDGQIFVASKAKSLGLVSKIVTGITEASTALLQEVNMDRDTLFAQFPELGNALLEEGRKQAVATMPQPLSPLAVLAVLKPLMTAENYGRAEEFFQNADAFKLSFEQASAMADIAFKPVAAQDDAKTQILAGIQAATPSGVTPDIQKNKTKTAGEMLSEAAAKIRG